VYTDFIETYLTTTVNLPTPEIFRLWAAIATISGALQRRIWTVSYAGNTYPNIWVALAGRSGSGKSVALKTVQELWKNLDGVKIAPTNVTPAMFFEVLEASQKQITNPKNLLVTHSPVNACIREFGSFFPKYDAGYLSDLSDLYDCPPEYSLERKVAKSSNAINPCVNLIAAVTPAYLGDVLPEVAWGQGFCSRMLFIYGTREENYTNIFTPPTDISNAGLVTRLQEIHALYGEVAWTTDAREFLISWFTAGALPTPDHSRLTEYKTRRSIHMLKLSMISAVAAGRDLLVTKDDVERAKQWLLQAEATMPDIFRAMVQKSDTQVISDLHYHFYTIWGSQPREKRTPITEEQIYKYLKDRVESHKIKSLIETAERSGVLRKTKFPNEWLPAPLNERIEV